MTDIINRNFTETADVLIAPGDTLGATDTIPAADSLAAADTLAVTDSLAATDSLSAVDTLAASDTLPAEPAPVIIEPIDSAFTAGTLIPAEPTHAGEHYAYTNSVLLHVLAVVAIILILSVLHRLVRVLPSIFGCLLRWKEALHLEFSAKLSRDRDAVFAALFLPACLEIDRYDILLRAITENLGPELHLLIIAIFLLSYFGLRILMRNVCKGKKMNASTYSTADALFKTFFCAYIIICLITSGLLSVIGLSAELIKTVIFYETIAVFALFILRKGQILIRACSLFSTILYLCGLEILPAAIVIAPAVIF